LQEVLRDNSTRFNPRPIWIPTVKVAATGPPANHQAKNFQSARVAIAMSDGQWPQSFCEPDDFCPRSIPNQSSNQERFCENELAERAAEFLA
jgi:hypothetical protein